MELWERKIVTWLAGEHTGMSSKTIAFTALGIDYRDFAHPLDPEDLWRCAVLLRECPQVRIRAFPELKERSVAWARLIEHWQHLAHMLRMEIGNHLPEGPWEAPKTYTAMRAAIGLEA